MALWCSGSAHLTLNQGTRVRTPVGPSKLATAQIISLHELVTLCSSRAQSSAIISCRIHRSLHTEVKRHRARLVVRWGTTREVLVLRSSIVFFCFTLFNCASHVCLHGQVSLVHPRAQSSAIISCRIHPFPSAHGS